MTDKQQTAVQWLRDAMNGHLTEEDMRYVINKALAMERKQHVDTFTYAWIRAIIPGAKANVGDYLNNTYQTDL